MKYRKRIYYTDADKNYSTASLAGKRFQLIPPS